MAEMADLQESFMGVFSVGLLFAQMAKSQGGKFQPDIDSVRKKIIELLDNDESAKKLSEDDDKAAERGVVYWIDQIIMRHSKWRYSSDWVDHPLQHELYGTRDGGNDFFIRLNNLEDNQVASLSIYLRCLAFGFTGRYVDEPSKLESIQQNLGEKLVSQKEDPRKILINQPYNALTETVVSKPHASPGRVNPSNMMSS